MCQMGKPETSAWKYLQQPCKSGDLSFIAVARKVVICFVHSFHGTQLWREHARSSDVAQKHHTKTAAAKFCGIFQLWLVFQPVALVVARLSRHRRMKRGRIQLVGTETDLNQGNYVC